MNLYNIMLSKRSKLQITTYPPDNLFIKFKNNGNETLHNLGTHGYEIKTFFKKCKRMPSTTFRTAGYVWERQGMD